MNHSAKRRKFSLKQAVEREATGYIIMNKSIWPPWLGLGLHLWTWRKTLKNRKGNAHHSHIYLVLHHIPQRQSYIRRDRELLCGLGQGITPFCYRNINLYYHQSAGPGSLRDIHPHHWGKPRCSCRGPGGALPWRSAGTDNRYHKTESWVLTCSSRERMKEQGKGVNYSGLLIV